jgi:hypothetical protein
MTRRHIAFLGITLILGSAVSGCGWFGTAQAVHPHVASRPHRKAPPSSSPSSAPVSTSAPSSTSTASSTPAPTASSSAPPSSQAPPPPPNAGPFTTLKIESVTVTRDGVANASGKTEPVLLLTLTILNPSSGIVALQLNDFSVVPAGGPYQYSWNDYDPTGLTASNSLFWPIDPTTPTADPRYILSGTRVTGSVTVQVPSAASYDIVWGTPTSDNVAATFQAP